MSFKRLSFFSFFIVVFLISGHFFGWLSFPESMIRKVSGQLSGGVHALTQGVGEIFKPIVSSRALLKENKDCQEEVVTLSINDAELKELRDENELLRAQVNFMRVKNKYTLANVVGKTNDLSENVLILDKGEDVGVKVGKPVLANNGVLVGKIIKVEGNNSLVRLLTDNQSKIGVSILNKEKTIGVVSGEYNLRLKLGMVPLTETVISGDQIVTSGLETSVPRGLLVGQVESIEKELYQPFQSGYIKSAVDLSKLSIVSILLE